MCVCVFVWNVTPFNLDSNYFLPKRSLVNFYQVTRLHLPEHRNSCILGIFVALFMVRQLYRASASSLLRFQDHTQTHHTR